LYVGKAVNLKARLTSYKRLPALGGKTLRLVRQARKVRWQVLESEFAALLTEAELIRTYQPEFNVLLKDDKSPLYIYFTRDSYPQVKTGRWADLKGQPGKKVNVFGPFPSGYAAKRVLSLARKVVPFCSATPRQIAKRQPCFYFHLQLCPGPCHGDIDEAAYRKRLRQLASFLKGKQKKVATYLTSQMKLASRNQDFEKAALIKNQLDLLKRLFSQSDVISPELQLPHLTSDKTEEQLLRLRRLLRRFFSLPTHYPLDRIEGFDISNLSGTAATGSMVVFSFGQADPKQYRHFKIRTLSVPNDLKMLEEVLKRRSNHSEWPMPHLILIDGGKEQLKVASRVLPWAIPIVALAKKPDRLVVPSKLTERIVTVPLEAHDPATHLVQAIRDEAHRFSRRYHHWLRKREFLSGSPV